VTAQGHNASCLMQRKRSSEKVAPADNAAADSQFERFRGWHKKNVHRSVTHAQPRRFDDRETVEQTDDQSRRFRERLKSKRSQRGKGKHAPRNYHDNPGASASTNHPQKSPHPQTSPHDDPMTSPQDLSDLTIQTGIVTTETSTDSDIYLAMDITALCQRPSPQVLVTAMAARGVWTDDDGQILLLNEPLEYTENTMIGFELSEDGTYVNVLQPQLSLRTSDNQSQEAFERGVEAPFSYVLDNYGDKHNIIINGFELIDAGFFVTDDLFFRMTSRLVNVNVFHKNFDVTVEYIEPGLNLPVTFSLIELPDKPMKPRALDMRLGYFATEYLDVGAHDSREHELDTDANDRRTSMIWRYNLHSLPDRQIKIYIDPSVPERWRTYFKDGVESWNRAFAALGLHDAIRGVLPGDNDWPHDYDPGDARFSSISWAIDPEETYSMGIARVDPRSGEILCSNVVFGDGWVQAYLEKFARFESTQSLAGGVRREEIKQTQKPGGLGARVAAKRPKVSLRDHASPKSLSLLAYTFHGNQTEAIGLGLNDVVKHEVGHILGLRHNFKGSMGISLECTKNVTCSAEHGLSASIMDYLPINVPTEGIDNVHLWSPVIGGYDILAIKYGYLQAPAGSSVHVTNQMLEEVLTEYEEKGYQFCTDAEAAEQRDPTCDMDDLSSDPLSYYEDYLQQLSVGLPHLLERYVPPGSAYTNYGDAVQEFLKKAESIGYYASQWMGGINISYTSRGFDGSIGRAARLPIAADTQRRAFDLVLKVMRIYNSNLLPTAQLNKYLVQDDGYGLVEPVDLSRDVRIMQSYLIGALLNKDRLNQFYMIDIEEPVNQSDHPAGLNSEDFLNMLVDAVFGTTSGELLNLTSESQEWHLQLALANQLNALQKNSSGDDEMPTEVSAMIASHMDKSRAMVETALESAAAQNQEGALLDHLLLLQKRLRANFYDDESKWLAPPAPHTEQKNSPQTVQKNSAIREVSWLPFAVVFLHTLVSVMIA